MNKRYFDKIEERSDGSILYKRIYGTMTLHVLMKEGKLIYILPSFSLTFYAIWLLGLILLGIPTVLISIYALVRLVTRFKDAWKVAHAK